MGGKAIHQMATVFDQQPSDVMYGVRTVGGDPVNFSIDRDLVGYTIQNNTETLSNAQVLALFTTPVSIMTGTPGKILIPDRVVLTMTNGTINFTTNLTVLIGGLASIDDTHYHGAGTLPLVAFPKSVVFPALNVAGQITSIVEGDDLAIRIKTGNPAAGDGGLMVKVFYMEVDA